MKKEDIVKNYNARAGQYAEMIDDLFDDIWDRILTKVSIPQSGKVLDLGCGTGKTLSRIIRRQEDLNLTGIDLSPNMVVEAEKRIKPAAGRIGERLSLHCEDCLSFLKKAKPNNYDLVIASFLLGYVDPRQLFPAIFPVMKKGAKLVVIVTSGEEMDQMIKDFMWFFITHLHYFNPLELLLSKMNVSPPIGKTAQNLNDSGFKKIDLNKEIMEVKFDDPYKCVMWLDGSGFATGFFDITRKYSAEKKDQIYNDAIRYVVSHKIKFMGEPFIPGKPFMLRLPLHIIIAEK